MTISDFMSHIEQFRAGAAKPVIVRKSGLVGAKFCVCIPDSAQNRAGNTKKSRFYSVWGGFIEAIGDFMSHAEDRKFMCFSWFWEDLLRQLVISCCMSSNIAPVPRNMLLCANPDLSERNFAFVYLTALRTVPERPTLRDVCNPAIRFTQGPR